MPRKNSTPKAAVVAETAPVEVAPVPVPETALSYKAALKEAFPAPPKWTALDADRLAFVVQHARPAVSACLCGCGGTTKGRFVPGHDATLKEALKAGAKAGCADSITALATFGW